MGQTNERLSDYRSKRDFERINEPDEHDNNLDWADQRPVFVIHKHAASSLHYDFRLEVDGVLKSWVVPKGPSTDPKVKRLAIPTEDHPLSYANFEGVIPQDKYGAGTVMIWDRGNYQILEDSADERTSPLIQQQLEAGRVAVWLNGLKIKGGYVLVRTEHNDDERWLLTKMDDEEADGRRKPTSTENLSVATGRAMDEIPMVAGES